MSTFTEILDQALSHHEPSTLASRFPEVRTPRELAAIPDARILSAMARRIFSAGFRWSVVDRKWPEIESAFDHFDVDRVAAYDVERLAALQTDRRIIRHGRKIRAIVDNAVILQNMASEYGSAARWLADWPEDDVVGLWHALADRFSMLGGASGPYFLRTLGRDTFILTPDVLSTLKAHGLYAGKGTGKRDQQVIQEHFRQWRAESGRSFAALSMILAAAVGPHR